VGCRDRPADRPRQVLTRDEGRILSWSADNTLRLWDAATGQQIGPAMRHEGRVWNRLIIKEDEMKARQRLRHGFVGDATVHDRRKALVEGGGEGDLFQRHLRRAV
jgi:hypothetical protein